MNVKKIKKDFPILKKKINGNRLVYLDNAATTQKPIQVIEAISCYYKNSNANIHRGSYELSAESSSLYEEAKKETAKFINARKWNEIIFTKNTTESINLLSFSLGEKLKKGDLILTTKMEHHSNLIPWQQLKKKGIKLEFVEITKEGKLNEKDLEEKLEKKPKIFSFSGASNVLGTVNEIKELTKKGKEVNSIVIIDAAQLVPHKKINAKKLNVDFIAFSSHKMLGPTGIGILYGKEELLEKMNPFLTGGDMISKVSLKKSYWNSLPWKFEAGTPNIAGGIGFRIALKYLKKIGMEKITAHETKLLKYATQEMNSIKGIEIYGPKEKKLGILAFNIKGVHPHDVSAVLDKKGIAIRSGNHCAQPLMQELGIKGSARASFYLYNEKEDVNKLIEGIKEVKKIFRVN
jgi:cysteine desulfurase/selenocysteine lyase